MPLLQQRWLKLSASLLGTAAIGVFLAYQAASYFGEVNAADYDLARRMRTKMVLENMGTIAIGDTLPNQTFTTSEGTTVQLSDLMSERTVVIFADPGCGACVAELEQLRLSVNDSMNYRYFVLIAPVSPELLTEFGNELGIACPMLSDPDGEYTYGLEIMGTPFNLIVNRSLVIENAVATYMNSRDFVDIIDFNNRQ